MREGANSKFKYYQIYCDLLARIQAGEWLPGQRIEGERGLCEQYKASRITIRDTLEMLEQDGYIFRKQGQGTFVALREVEQKLTKLYSLRSELRKQKIPLRTKVLSFETVPADEGTAKHLSVPIGEAVWELRRLYTAQSMPFTVEKTYLPKAMFPMLTREMIAKNGLYRSMRGGRCIPERAEEKLRIVAAGEFEADQLEIAHGSLVVDLARTTYCQNEIIEYSVNTILPSFFTYTVTLES